MKLLTVITVNYNNAEGLKRTLNSVIPQLSERVDYVVVDGGSFDASTQIIEQVAPKLHYWCSEQDGGIYQGMNKGVKHSDGRYLLFINSGDELCPGILSMVLPLLERGEVDIFYGNIRYVDPQRGKRWVVTYPEKLTLSHLYESNLPHPGSFIRRQLLLDIPYDENLRIIADYEFFIKAIMLHGCSTRHIPLTISNFYLDGVSYMNREKHDVEMSAVKARLFSPVLVDAAGLSKVQTLGCYPEIEELMKTRKLHHRVRPLLRMVLALDRLFHLKK